MVNSSPCSPAAAKLLGIRRSSGFMPSRPATSARSVPWPRPVSAKEPYRPMSALTGRSPSSVRAIRPIRTAPAVWELDGPTMIGPRISKMSSISIPPVFFCYDGSICPLFLQAASCGKLSVGRPRGRPSRLRRKTDSVPSKAVMIPVLQKPASTPPFVIQLSSLDSKTTVSTWAVPGNISTAAARTA